jgi:hypothetical protein
MNMPSFTAEAALCTTRGHYQTRRDAINLATQSARAVHLSLEISDEAPRSRSTRAGQGSSRSAREQT